MGGRAEGERDCTGREGVRVDEAGGAERMEGRKE